MKKLLCAFGGVARNVLTPGLAGIILAGCGTFQLASNIRQDGKSPEQINLDILLCKDQANLATNTAGWQAGQFVAGATLVGIPIALQMEKDKKREVFSQCMTARGYSFDQAKENGPQPGNRVTATKIGGNNSVIDNAPAALPFPKADLISTPPPTQRVPNTNNSASVVPAVQTSNPPATDSSVPLSQKDEVVQLEKLKTLREKGLITDGEYNDKRKAILDKL